MSVEVDESTDEELVAAAQAAPQGDTRGFERLVQRYQAKVLANCRYLTKSSHEAEDLAQEVFVKAYFGLAKFEGRSQFRTWLNRIKVNHCLNHLEKSNGKRYVDIDDPALDGDIRLQVGASAEKAMLSADRRRQIGAVLDAMPDTLRVPLVMCDLDELSYDQIADLLGIGLSAVKMRIKRGRAQFQRLLAGLESSAASHSQGEAVLADRS
jgi:RNA polymerase sigma-70 factor (ECF subfamily)